MKGINHIAVVVSVILHQILGFLWYSPAPWVNTRLEALGRPLTEASAVDPGALALDIAGWFLASYVIAWLIRKIGADTAVKGALLGLVLWLGLAIPTLVPHYAFAGLKPVVTVIDMANVLVACLMTGTLLAAWPKKSA